MYVTQLKDNVKSVQALPPGTRKINTIGASIDCRASQSVYVTIEVGPWTDGTHAYSIWEAPDVSGAPGVFTQTAAANINTGRDTVPPVDAFGVINITDNTKNGTVIAYTYIGAAPWIQVRQTVGGAPATGLESSVMVTLSDIRAVGNTPMASNAAY